MASAAKLLVFGGIAAGLWYIATRNIRNDPGLTQDEPAEPEPVEEPPPSPAPQQQGPISLPDELVDLWEKCIDPMNVRACSVDELQRARDLILTEVANTSDAAALATLKEMLRVINGVGKTAYPTQYAVGHKGKSVGACCDSCAHGGACESECPDKILEAQPATGA